jgi:hypothetical protein
MMRVRVLKNWDNPDITRQSPLGDGVWNGVKFCFKDSEAEYDALLALNYPDRSTQVRCPPRNTGILVQEPFVSLHRDWIIRSQQDYSWFFCHYFPQPGPNFIPSHPAVPWHIGKTYAELVHGHIMVKTDRMSCITSNLRHSAGHKLRYSFVKKLADSIPRIDIYGKGNHYVRDKWDALSPYQYSIAIENSTLPNYWTEKLADCFLSWTVPVYYGCPNIYDYFPKKSIILIDIRDAEGSFAKIREILEEDVWEERIPALKEARELVLNKYQFFPHVSNLLQTVFTDFGTPQIVNVRTYNRPLTQRLANCAEAWYYKYS